MKTIGLTGGIASGKSTVAELLRQRKLPVLDADQVSRQVVAPGSDGLAAVVDAFGPAVLAPDGSLDRKALGAMVRDDTNARRRLEAITHPRIRAALLAALASLAQQGHPAAAVEAALLVETGSFRLYDAVVLVRCRRKTQLARLQAREGWDADAAARWVATQMSLDDKAHALLQAQAEGGPVVVLLDNDGDRDALAQALDRAWTTLQERLGLPAQ